MESCSKDSNDEEQKRNQDAEHNVFGEILKHEDFRCQLSVLEFC